VIGVQLQATWQPVWLLFQVLQALGVPVQVLLLKVQLLAVHWEPLLFQVLHALALPPQVLAGV
jgi:hypothetical protein